MNESEFLLHEFPWHLAISAKGTSLYYELDEARAVRIDLNEYNGEVPHAGRYHCIKVFIISLKSAHNPIDAQVFLFGDHKMRKSIHVVRGDDNTFHWWGAPPEEWGKVSIVKAIEDYIFMFAPRGGKRGS